jgi:hypothetical protein
MVYTNATNGLKKQLENWHQLNWRKVNKAMVVLHSKEKPGF